MICTISKIKKMFDRGNVCVCGLRGTGKDMLFGNVISRRKRPYISNMDYKCKISVHIPLDFSKIDPLNNYKQFISRDLVHYEYPYPEKCDIYISDAGIYFPSQYCSELNKQYANMPVFQALSRHLGDCNFHVNVQNLNRVWDKIREQSDIYISCQSCHVFFHGKFVVQTVIIYDNSTACIDRVQPFKPISVPLFGSTQRALMQTKNAELVRSFREKNGTVRKYTFFYRNKTGYDTRLFKSILSGGVSREAAV